MSAKVLFCRPPHPVIAKILTKNIWKYESKFLCLRLEKKPMKRNVFFLFFVSGVAFAQSSDSLQLDSLIVKLHHVIDLQRSIEIEEIKGVYRITPWHFVPSLNYDFINNRYYFTVSSGPLVSNMINKRQETRKLSAIERKYDNQIKSSEIKLRSVFISLNQSLANLYLSFEIVSNDIEIFIIKRTEHANNEIDTETFLQARSSILNKIRNHNNEVASIQRQLLEIELLTEKEISIDLASFFISPEAIVPSIPAVP